MGADGLFIGRARLYHLHYQSSTRKTVNSPGPCMPIVRDISISAVREGPVMTTAELDCRTAGRVIAAAREGRMIAVYSTARWMRGRSEAWSGCPSPLAIRIDPVSARPQTALVTPT